MILYCAGKPLDLSHPVVMGVLNVTPDSFSDGGNYLNPMAALQRGREIVEQGAALIDIGGESTRPGAITVSVQEELDRVIPLVEKLSQDLPVPISVDTSKPEVMEEALRAGAGLINDIRALRVPGALETVATSDALICLMHMQGAPSTMQHNPEYGDVVSEVAAFLGERIDACRAMGIDPNRLIIDPGFGFGKTLCHNLILLKNLSELRRLGRPLLVGLSRKSMLGKLTDMPVNERLASSLGAAVIAAWQGAHIIRAHDVKETVQALKICNAVKIAS